MENGIAGITEMSLRWPEKVNSDPLARKGKFRPEKVAFLKLRGCPSPEGGLVLTDHTRKPLIGVSVGKEPRCAPGVKLLPHSDPSSSSTHTEIEITMGEGTQLVNGFMIASARLIFAD